jgi:uncharacterized membrane protein
MYRKSKINVKKDIKVFILTLLISLIINIISIKKIITIPNNIIGNFILGSVESVTSIVPGISGTSILIILNSYERVLSSFSEVLNIKKFSETIYFFIPFIIGIVFNTIIISKIINKQLKNNYNKTYTIIFAIIIVSTIFLLMHIKKFFITYFCTGFFFYKIINKYFSK